jgi:hypothetical protein
MNKGGKNDVIMIVSTSGRITQLSGKSEVQKGIKNKSGTTSPIKHQIFLTFSNMAKIENDKFWEDLFMSAAKNNFPKNFRLENSHILQYKFKNKVQIVDLGSPSSESQEIQEKYMTVKQFISNHSGLMSNKDQEEFLFDVTPKVTWSNIISPKNKILFLKVFCFNMKKQFSLSEEQSHRLFELLVSYLIIKEIVDTDIIMENGIIVAIRDVYFSPGQFTITRFPTISKKKNKSVEPKSPCYTFGCSKQITAWEKKFN